MAAILDDLDDLGELDENLGRQRRGHGQAAGTSKVSAVTGKVSAAKGAAAGASGPLDGGARSAAPDGGVSKAADKVKAMGINNHQMRGVKDWVTARDDEQWSLLPEGMVAVNVSHSNLSQKMLELRLSLIHI